MGLTEAELAERLGKLVTAHRYRHSIGVMNMAVQLAERYGVDMDKARIAGLLHDCARDLPQDVVLKLAEQWHVVFDEIERAEPKLIHGPLGAEYARRQFEIEDPEILDAIRFHVTGRERMTPLEKIVYVADCIELGRAYKGVSDIRRAVKSNLDVALTMAQNQKLGYLIKRSGLIHPRAVVARNSVLLSLRGTEKGKDVE
ncbi:MAG TPA: HD domain-containing protein [Firmicutes bacterium]|nr:HD domain-containing protein [Bacillota bacterium]